MDMENITVTDTEKAMVASIMENTVTEKVVMDTAAMAMPMLTVKYLIRSLELKEERFPRRFL